MFFDRESWDPSITLRDNTDKSSRIGIIFITLDNGIIMHSLTLTEGHSNNETEYEALIAGLELALEIPIDDFIVYGDSKLVVCQMNGLYHIKKPSLTPYFQKAKYLTKMFRHLQIHVRRDNNRHADALDSLTTCLTHPRDDYLFVHIGERRVVSPLASTIE